MADLEKYLARAVEDQEKDRTTPLKISPNGLHARVAMAEERLNAQVAVVPVQKNRMNIIGIREQFFLIVKPKNGPEEEKLWQDERGVARIQLGMTGKQVMWVDSVIWT